MNIRLETSSVPTALVGNDAYLYLENNYEQRDFGPLFSVAARDQQAFLGTALAASVVRIEAA